MPGIIAHFARTRGSEPNFLPFPRAAIKEGARATPQDGGCGSARAEARAGELLLEVHVRTDVPMPAPLSSEEETRTRRRRARDGEGEEPELASSLVEAAKEGSARAFEELVRRYRPRIYALALHLTGRASDADDVTQEAFLKAYQHLDRFEGRSEFFTWLYRIALYRALNHRRDRGRRAMVPLSDPRLAAALEIDASGDPCRILELEESYARLLAAFDWLSPVLRTTVVLVQLQGLSHREAAVVLGTTEGTVAWRIHEARRQLRASLERLESRRAPASATERARAVGRHRFDGDLLAAAVAALLPAPCVSR